MVSTDTEDFITLPFSTNKRTLSPKLKLAVGFGLVLVIMLLSVFAVELQRLKQRQALDSEAKQQAAKAELTKQKTDPTEVLIKFRGNTFQLPGEGKLANKNGRYVLSLEKQTDASLPYALQILKKTNRIRTIERVIPISKLEKSQQGSLDGIYKLTLTNPKKINEALMMLSMLPEIEFAEPNYIVSASFEPNDPFYLDHYPDLVQGRDPTWNPTFDYHWNLKKINAQTGWDVSTGAEDVSVAVIDTGVDCSLTELAGVCLPGYDFANYDDNPIDDHGHGTHVAGTISELGNNGVGGTGISWGSKIIPVKALNSGGSGSIDQIYQAIIFAVNNGADVINMSLGYGPQPQISETLKLALDEANAQGITVVAAAGNNNADIALGFWPANYPTVISVGATDAQDVKATYSNYGNALTVAAPGGGGSEQDGSNYGGRSILSLRSNNNGSPVTMGGGANIVSGNYLRARGTSMASPHVAGLAALILSANPTLSGHPDLVRNVIANGTDDLGAVGFDVLYGFGRINVGTAIQEMDTTPIPQAMIFSPSDKMMVNPMHGVSFSGTATAPNFMRYTLSAYPLGAPENSELLFESTAPVDNNTLGTWQNTVDSGDYVVELKVFYNETLSRSTFITLGVDTTLKQGWPQFVGDRVYRSPTVADLNHDGKMEIIAGTIAGDVFIFSANGTPFAPWQTLHINNSTITDQISVGNLDADADLELLIGWYSYENSTRKVSAYNFDGSLVAGAWPYEHPNYVMAGVTLKDLTADGIDEVIFPLYYPSQLMVLSANATVLPGWPQPLDSYAFYGNAAIGDLDPQENNGQEIAYLSQSHISIFQANGSKLAATALVSNDFPFSAASPMIGDLDGDGSKEIIFMERSLSGPMQIAAVTADGSRLTNNFPIVSNYTAVHEVATYVLPTLVNADNDTQLEIMMGNKLYDNGQASTTFTLNYPGPFATLVAADIDSNGTQEFFTQGWLDTPQLLYGWDASGGVLSGFPKKLLSSTVGPFAYVQPNTPVVTDLDAVTPRKSELVAASGGYIFVFDVSGSSLKGNAEVAYLHSTPNNARVYLPEGRTLVSYGLNTNTMTGWSQAENFLDWLAAGGSLPLSVNNWINGGWSGHVKDFPFNNFLLQPGKGYLIEANRKVEPNFDAVVSNGSTISELTYNLTPSWNFISIPSTLLVTIPKQGDVLRAEDLCVAAANQNAVITEVDMLATDEQGVQFWQPHICGTADANFTIKEKTGYMLLAQSVSSFILPPPNGAESKPTEQQKTTETDPPVTAVDRPALP